MRAAELLVRCLENEGVEYIFGIPGEENIDIMDALLESRIKFVTTRHEQGAAFMADVYGRLTGRAGVCMATLGPGATNLITGFADANMDRAPIVAIAGQGATTRLHKESHQILDLVELFRPITKYTAQILEPEIVPEVVRKAFKVAQTEKPGGSFIDFPENIAEMEVDAKPIKVQTAYTADAPAAKIEQAAQIISDAKYPLILAGNGVIRQGAADALVTFAEVLRIPGREHVHGERRDAVLEPVLPRDDRPQGARLELVRVRKSRRRDLRRLRHGRVPPRHVEPEQRQDDRAHRCAARRSRCALHRRGRSARRHHGVSQRHRAQGEAAANQSFPVGAQGACRGPQRACARRQFPVKPQKIVWDVREVLGPEDIAISDVGAHKMWMSRMYRAERPNTCIISNGFASMGIGVPGAIAAKLAYPERKVLVCTGDAGFLMNSQEIETALRMKTPFVILIWNDSEYGLITWHQMRHFGRPSHIEFKNPDFVKYAESFGAKGYRIERTEDLAPTLKKALADDTVSIVDCPVDYRENMKLTEKLKTLASPL